MKTFELNGSIYDLHNTVSKTNYSYFTYLSKNETTKESVDGNIVGGFDTEFVDYREKDANRKIVSYQFWCNYKDYKVGILIIPEGKYRLRFKEFLNILTTELCNIYRLPVKFNLCLVSHWGAIDYSTFKDFKKTLNKKRTVYQYKRCIFTSKPVKFNTYKGKNTKRECMLSIRDSFLCGPAKFSLDKLGRSLGIEKIELDEGIISSMDTLYKNDIETFTRYAIQDCVITASWVTSTYDVKNIPTTVGQYASSWTENYLKEKRGWNDKKSYLKNYKGKTILSKQKGKRVTEEEISLPHMGGFEDLAMRSVKGGLNAAYSCGVFSGDFLDIDICGAYPSAASCLRDIDFEIYPSAISGELNLNNIRGDQYGFGFVRFKFPDDCQFPCLSIKDPDNRGLIFVLEGEAYATNIEVYNALLLGAKVYALNYFLLQSKDTYVYRDLFKDATHDRAKYKKGTAKELLIKERNNSIVGKVGQGINDHLLNKKNGMPFSEITNAYYYSTTTAIIRSFLLYTMNWIHSNGYHVHSVTTDGFITDAPLELIYDMPDNTITKMLKEARYYISGEPDIVSVKHSMDILVNMKTRANIGINDDNSGLGVLACGNYKIPKEIKEKMKEDARRDIAKMYFKRSIDNPVEYDYLKFTEYRRYIANNDLDISSHIENRKANWEYDFKQQPVDITDVELHLDNETFIVPTFKTKPWKTFKAFSDVRDFIDNEKLVFNKSEYYKELPFLYNARKAGIKVTDINKTKAQQMLRMCIMEMIDYGNLEKEDLVDRIADYYKVKVSDAFYSNNKRAGNIVLPTKVLKDDIEEISFDIIDKSNDFHRI